MSRFIFSSNGSNASGGIYSTDGTAAGTQSLGLTLGDPDGSSIVGNGPEVDGRSFFVADQYAGDGAEASDLFSTDGTAAGTKLLSHLDYSEDPVPVGVWNLNGIIVAAGAIGGGYGPPGTAALFASSDGTTFTQITTGVTTSDIVYSNGNGFFAAVDQQGNNLGLWRTNGTAAGTYGIAPPGILLNPTNFAATAGGLTVFANLGNNSSSSISNNSSLWVTDGTINNTHQIVNAALGTNILTKVAPATVGGKLVFAAIDTAGQYSVWTTDGTPRGTLEITQTGVANASTRPITGLTAWGSKLIIVTGYGLNVCNIDGSDPQDIVPWLKQLGTSPPSDYITLGNKLILTSPSANYNGVDLPITLYVSDGTSNGTIPLVVAGLQSFTGDFTLVGSQIVFTGIDMSGKQAFFTTDGTAAGSHELALPAGIVLDPTILPRIEALPDPAPIIPVKPTPPPVSGIVTLGGGSQAYSPASGATVQAGSGGDTITATAGNVTVSGSSGELTFYGGSAASSVTGASGAATIFGGTGGGTYQGGAGGHNVFVSQGAAGVTTAMTGDGADDQIFGSASGNDVLSGGQGRDSIVGGGGPTTIDGGGTASIIFTGAGPSIVNGGSGGHDTIVGGSGALAVTAHGGDAIFGNTGALNVTGSLTAADSIIGGSGTLSIRGEGGNMLVVGGAGASNVSIGDGASLIFAGAGNLSLVGGAGSMQVLGGSGTATIIEGSGSTTLQVVNGSAGGTDIISGFRPGIDRVELFGYLASQQTVSSSTGSTVLSLSDGGKVTLLGVADPQQSIIG